MTTMTSMPLYFKCFFFDRKNKKVVFTYKIEPSDDQSFPFQLLKRVADGPMGWMRLSAHASVHDSLGILLIKLFTEEVSKDIYRGQPSADASAVLESVDNGEKTIALYDATGNQSFRLEYDVAVEDLVQRKARPRLLKRIRKSGIHIG